MFNRLKPSIKEVFRRPYLLIAAFSQNSWGERLSNSLSFTMIKGKIENGQLAVYSRNLSICSYWRRQ